MPLKEQKTQTPAQTVTPIPCTAQRAEQNSITQTPVMCGHLQDKKIWTIQLWLGGRKTEEDTSVVCVVESIFSSGLLLYIISSAFSKFKTAISEVMEKWVHAKDTMNFKIIILSFISEPYQSYFQLLSVCFYFQAAKHF